MEDKAKGAKTVCGCHYSTCTYSNYSAQVSQSTGTGIYMFIELFPQLLGL